MLPITTTGDLCLQIMNFCRIGTPNKDAIVEMGQYECVVDE